MDDLGVPAEAAVFPTVGLKEILFKVKKRTIPNSSFSQVGYSDEAPELRYLPCAACSNVVLKTLQQSLFSPFE